MSGLANRESAQPARYVYDALGPRQIRLLRVVSCSDRQAECELRHVELDSDEEWYALSYVWGNEDPDCEVLLNGKSLPIRANLLTALKALEYFQGELGRECWIWIDAICLNQDDNVEKSERVPEMGEIYRGASQVMIWLGDEEACPPIVVETFHFLWASFEFVSAASRENAREAGCNSTHPKVSKGGAEITYWYNICMTAYYELHRRFGVRLEELVALEHVLRGLIQFRADDPVQPNEETTRVILEESRFKEDFFKPAHPFWGSLLAFAEHEWHRRVWTMQEYLLAKKNVLLTSRGVIDWDFILEFLNIFVTSLPVREFISDNDFKRTYARGRPFEETVLILPHVGENRRRPTTPGTFLKRIGLRRCNLAKDRVYGLLGLLDAESRSRIAVDYSASDASVFVNAVRVAIGVETEYAWLGRLWNEYERTPKTMDGLPSWCPDFSAMNCIPPVKGINSFELEPSISKKYTHLAQVDVGRNDWILGFAGVHLDQVQRSVPICLSLPKVKARTPAVECYFDISSNMEFYEYLQCLQSTFCNASGKFLPQAELFLHSFYADPKDLSIQNLQNIVWFCSELHRQSIKSRVAAARILGLDLENVDRLLLCIAEFSIVQANRFFFETTAGRMGFSWFPPSSGDNIIYVPGGKCLNIISREGSKYVGAAYVEGFEGDALLTILSTLEDKWETFYVS